MIRRLGMMAAAMLLLGCARPESRMLNIPARDGVSAHSAHLLFWQTDKPGPRDLLIYQPGWGGSADENTILLSNLCSAGFNVAAVDVNVPQPPDFAATASRIALPMDFSSPAAADRTVAEGDWRAIFLAQDAAAIVGLLPEAAKAPAIGILGYSFGGAVAVNACAEDRRFAACLNMDGWVFGPAAERPPPQPYMLISGSPYPATPQAAATPAARYDELDSERLRRRMATAGGFYAEVAGLRHGDFTDANGGNPAVQQLARAFFTQMLLGRPSPLLGSDHPLSGVTLHRFAGSSGHGTG